MKGLEKYSREEILKACIFLDSLHSLSTEDQTHVIMALSTEMTVLCMAVMRTAHEEDLNSSHSN